MNASTSIRLAAMLALGTAAACPALAAQPAAAPAAAVQAAPRLGNEHPPNAEGLNDIEAMILDCDDALALIAAMKADVPLIQTNIDAANNTLTQIAQLIDAINARVAAASSAAAPTPTPPQQ